MEKNEMIIFNGESGKVYCSKNVESESEKKELFNALEECDVLLNDCIGEEIEIKDLYVEENQRVDKESGELKTKFRTIIFDNNGKTYATGSYGIYNVIKKIVNIYGLPDTWENPVKVKVIKRNIGQGKQSLSLTLV